MYSVIMIENVNIMVKDWMMTFIKNLKEIKIKETKCKYSGEKKEELQKVFEIPLGL